MVKVGLMFWNWSFDKCSWNEMFWQIVHGMKSSNKCLPTIGGFYSG